MKVGNGIAEFARKGDGGVRSQAIAPRHRRAAELLAHDDSVESFPRKRDRATMSVNMTPASARNALADAVLSFQSPEEAIQQQVRQIHQVVLTHSQYIRAANYTVMHPEDLQLLLAAYDKVFFAGHCRLALDGRKLRFRLSPRMTRAGGTTARFVTAAGQTFYEITVASSMMFEEYGNVERRDCVCALGREK